MSDERDVEQFEKWFSSKEAQGILGDDKMIARLAYLAALRKAGERNRQWAWLIDCIQHVAKDGEKPSCKGTWNRLVTSAEALTAARAERERLRVQLRDTVEQVERPR